MEQKTSTRFALPGGGNIVVMRPDASGKEARRAVVVLTAIAGINNYVEARAQDLAAQGYLVVIPDYFARSGAVPDLSTPELIGAAVAAIDSAQVLGDIKEALQWCATQGVAPGHAAALGFCIGGSFALLAGSAIPSLAGAVNYYGQLLPGGALDAADSLGCPVLCHYGDYDRLVGAADILQYTTRLRSANKSYELFMYAGAPHAFDEWFRPEVYRPVASRLAWQRSIAFLEGHLARNEPHFTHLT